MEWSGDHAAKCLVDGQNAVGDTTCWECDYFRNLTKWFWISCFIFGPYNIPVTCARHVAERTSLWGTSCDIFAATCLVSTNDLTSRPKPSIVPDARCKRYRSWSETPYPDDACHSVWSWMETKIRLAGLCSPKKFTRSELLLRQHVAKCLSIYQLTWSICHPNIVFKTVCWKEHRSEERAAIFFTPFVLQAQDGLISLSRNRASSLMLGASGITDEMKRCSWCEVHGRWAQCSRKNGLQRLILH